MKRNPSRRNPYLMEFVKTPSFWCPHVDHAACTNFSTRPSSFDRRSVGKSSIFPFPFLFSVFFFVSFFPPSTKFFCSFFVYEFFCFLFAFLFLNISSHFIFSSFLFLLLFFSFSLFFGIFSPLWSIFDRMVKGGNFLPLSSCHLCGP